MDAPTTTIFSYTNSFWFWHAQPFKKGEQELYDPQSLYNPEKPFPVPPTYWYLDNDGKSVWLRGLIESIMVPTHVFDCFVGWYRKAEDREEMEEAHRQGMMDMVTQTRRANAERARELRAQTVSIEFSWSKGLLGYNLELGEVFPLGISFHGVWYLPHSTLPRFKEVG